MLCVSQTTCASTGEVLDRALDAVEFYGFQPLDALLKEHKPSRTPKQFGSPMLAHNHERRLAAVVRQLVSHGFTRDSRPRFAYQLDSNKSAATLGMHSIGSQDSIAEGMLLAIISTILRDSGIEDFTIHLSSIGDRESAARFHRDLHAFMRSRLNDLPAPVREDMHAGNVIRAFTRLAEKYDELADGAPSPMEYLNDDSRAHLRGVLEYLENMDVPYELDPTVLGSIECWQHTLFDVRMPGEAGDVVIARGGRHNTLAQKSYRVDLPAVSIMFEHENHGRTKPRRRAPQSAKFFYAQLGPLARVQSFAVLEDLRRSGVPVRQMIAHESIGDQLREAQEAATPYTVIIGHKEALEGTAIVRNMTTHAQTVVPVNNLPGYLKRLKV